MKRFFYYGNECEFIPPRRYVFTKDKSLSRPEYVFVSALEPLLGEEYLEWLPDD